MSSGALPALKPNPCSTPILGNELDACGFEGTGNGNQIIPYRRTAATFEISHRGSADFGSIGQIPLRPADQPSSRPAQRGRETIRALLRHPQFAWSRPEPIGESAIRRRLRLIQHHRGSQVAWAFGLAPAACPNHSAAPSDAPNRTDAPAE